MEIIRHSRHFKCTICVDWPPNCVRFTFSLSDLHSAALNGCARCKLLADSVNLFQQHWSYSGGVETEKVTVMLERSIAPFDNLFHIFIQWQSRTGSQDKLELQIAQENTWDIPWPGFDIINLPLKRTAGKAYIQLIKDWLHRCDQSHDECSVSPQTGADKAKRLLRIDNDGSVYKATLVDNPEEGPAYTALSHCWGSPDDVPKTVKQDFNEGRPKQFPLSDLSRIFREAACLTVELGLKYIWIDSLCIVQDDEEEKVSELPKMGSIYGDAYLVIAASLAGNGHCGLGSTRSAIHRVNFESQSGYPIKAIVRSKINHSVWKAGEQSWSAPELPLFHRAWAFQERLLARRIVHFTPSELVWECRTCTMCECGDLQNALTSSPEFGAGRNLKTKYFEVTKYGSDIDRLKFWHDICAQFSARNITKTSDRLSALSSIARQIGMPDLLGPYYAGIWGISLPESLMWWSEYTDAKFYPGSTTQTHLRKRPLSVPSWSWLSIEGRVTTWGRCWSTTARLLGVNYQHAGYDLYGACKVGIIVLAGKAEQVEIVLESTPGGAMRYFIRRPAIDECFDFLSDTYPFEYSLCDLKGARIIALQMGCSDGTTPWNCIILKQLSRSPTKYERLGIADCGDEWFRSCDTQVVNFV